MPAGVCSCACRSAAPAKEFGVKDSSPAPVLNNNGVPASSFSSFVKDNLPTITKLRKEIHSNPELSFTESATAERLIQFLTSLKTPPEIVRGIGGTGFLAIFDFEVPDGADPVNYDNVKTIVFRSELDAVPVEEKNDFEHISKNHGVSHKCGHDGHMAILAGLALLITEHYVPEHGRVVLLFQPAEETGEGAQRMVDSGNEVLDGILKHPLTTIFALHNVPGFPLGSIVLPRGASFASASKGFHAKLTGATSHASQPYAGRNPALAMCNIIQALLAMPSLHVPYDQKAIVTIVGARVGEKAFGVSAGDAEIMATLRATKDTTLAILEEKAKALVSGLAATYDLSHSITWEDPFAATINDLKSVDVVRGCAAQCEREIFWMEEAFPWSEDFGVFLQKTPGAMFGLGLGEKHEPLHGEFYDFPDEMTVHGVTMFASILQQILEEQNNRKE